MILTPTGEVAAVVDWELCTLADVGTRWPTGPTREEMANRYAQSSGRDISELDFFLALGYWKLAIILEGVYARYAAGAYGEIPAGMQQFALDGGPAGRGDCGRLTRRFVFS